MASFGFPWCWCQTAWPNRWSGVGLPHEGSARAVSTPTARPCTRMARRCFLFIEPFYSPENRHVMAAYRFSFEMLEPLLDYDGSTERWSGFKFIRCLSHIC